MPRPQQVRHGAAARHIRQKPQRVRQHPKEPCVGIGQNRLLRPEPQVVNGSRQVRTPNEIEPLLHIGRVDEVRRTFAPYMVDLSSALLRSEPPKFGNFVSVVRRLSCSAARPLHAFFHLRLRVSA